MEPTVCKRPAGSNGFVGLDGAASNLALDANAFLVTQSFTLLYRRLAVGSVFAFVQRVGLRVSAAD